MYDSGTVSVTVNGFQASVNYGQGSTSATTASALASALNASSSPVTATASGIVVNLASKVSGSAGDYPLSASWTYDTGHFSSSSFTATASGSTLTGDTDCVGLRETYDYNSRLQPVRIQLGTTSNRSADY